MSATGGLLHHDRHGRGLFGHARSGHAGIRGRGIGSRVTGRRCGRRRRFVRRRDTIDHGGQRDEKNAETEQHDPRRRARRFISNLRQARMHVRRRYLERSDASTEEPRAKGLAA